MRDSIFIGHSNSPKDNEFTQWIQGKLINEGYCVESDFTYLIGGEKDFWKNLQLFIRDRSLKYLLVLSKDTFSKDGVIDEWEYSISIEKENPTLKDFVIPIRIDDVSLNERIGLNKRNVIDFVPHWSTGLKRILKKLEFDNVYKRDKTPLSVTEWQKNQYSNYSGIIDRKEIFFSNWITIPSLPNKIYFFEFYNDTQAKEIINLDFPFPIISHGTYVISFEKTIPTFSVSKGFDIGYKNKFEIEVSNSFNIYSSEVFPTYQDLRRLLVNLLRRALEMHLKNIGLSYYELSNHKKCFYFVKEEDKKVKGTFEILGKTKNIGVVGNYYDSFWHFGLSFNPRLYPFCCYNFKTHILFSDDGKNIWGDKSKIHAARRKKGKMMFNKQWRDQFLSFLSCISNDSDSKEVKIALSSEHTLNLSTTPFQIESLKGYQDPTDEERITPIDELVEEEVWDEEEQSEE